jgi:MFS family permease
LVREPVKTPDTERTTLLQDFVKCGREPALRFIMIHNWVNAILGSIVTSTLIIYLSQIAPNLTGSAQGLVFAIPGILVALLALRWVKLGERISFHQVIAIGLLGAGGFYAIMGLSVNVWLFIPAFIVCRVFATAVNPCLSALISRDVPPEYRGRAFGIQTSVGIMGELSAQILVASVGQLLGIHVLYVVVGLGVFSLGMRNYHALAGRRDADAVLQPEEVKEAG